MRSEEGSFWGGRGPYSKKERRRHRFKKQLTDKVVNEGPQSHKSKERRKKIKGADPARV